MTNFNEEEGKQNDSVATPKHPSTTDKKPQFVLHKKICIIVALSILMVLFIFSLTTEYLARYYPGSIFPASSTSTVHPTKNRTMITTNDDYSIDDDRSVTPLNQPDPRNIMNRLLKQQYPECHLPVIDLKSMGSYVPATDPSPPYDHLCFIMKARYNCAYRPNAPFRMAHHYELILTKEKSSSNDTTKPCRIKALVKDTLEEWSNALKHYHRPNSTNDAARTSSNKVNVILQGNSYLRQVWEALVCGMILSSSRFDFSDLVTDFAVQQDGPGISLKDFMKRNHLPIDVHELGIPLTNHSDLQRTGCHGESQSDISKYYRRKATIPPNLPGCNDNVAVVELGHQWRFSYVFKPSMYTSQALQYLYQDRLKITQDPSSELVLVWNSVMKEPQNMTPPVSTDVVIVGGASLTERRQQRQLEIESWLWSLRDLQLRDLGRYHGANNPWISNPPDYHACMPGTPDDQVHLLLYWLWSGYEIKES